MRAKDLSAEEKLRLICGKDLWHTEDLGGKLSTVTMSDGPVGVRQVTDVLPDGRQIAKPSIAYPAVQLLASAWSRKAAKTMGECLADDCTEAGIDLLLAPGVNIKRSPYNGRNFEYFSEDPYLTGTLAYAYVCGLQENGVGACVKHFCANNLEENRLHRSSEVDERTLREIYYKPFEFVCAANPVAVMCSYNRVNGVYASEYTKGFNVLRAEFSFDGAILSDWGAVRDRTKAAKAGLDLEMPFDERHYARLVADYAAGLLSDVELDECAQRVIDLAERCEAMRRTRRVKRSRAKRLAAAREIAAEGMVLLKNEGAVLPLRRGTKVAVCGCFGAPHPGMIAGGGSSRVEWQGEKWNLSELLSERLGGTVPFEPAFLPCDVESFSQDPAAALRNAAAAEVSIVCAGTGETIEYEGGDRKSLALPAVQERMIAELSSVNPNTVVLLFAGSAVDLSAWRDCVKGIVYVGFPGECGGEAIADLLTGIVCPSGKLAETFVSERGYAERGVRAPILAQSTLYREGTDVGYRHWNRTDAVLYPFGYGLSYAKFAYAELEVSAAADGLRVSFLLSNESEVCGKEISQIYIRPIAPFVYRPESELKGYEKTALAGGTRARVVIDLPMLSFAYYSVATDRWQVDDGVYEICVGASSQAIVLSRRIEIKDGVILL